MLYIDVGIEATAGASAHSADIRYTIQLTKKSRRHKGRIQCSRINARLHCRPYVVSTSILSLVFCVTIWVLGCLCSHSALNRLRRYKTCTDYGRPICNRANHYILPCDFYLYLFLSFFFFPRLISAVGDWMSSILPYFHTWRGLSANWNACLKCAARGSLQIQDAKNRHFGTIAQLCRAVSSQLRNVGLSTIGKKTC